MKWTAQSFVEEMEKRSPNIKIIGEYVNSSTKIRCECRLCGYKWEATPNKLLMGRNCYQCYRNRRAEMDRITEDEFLKRLQKNAPDIEIISEYNGFDETIQCKCKKCGYEWETTPKRVSRGAGCSKCANNIKKSPMQFLKEMENINPTIEILGEYINNRTKILCKCRMCGNKWESVPSRLLIGQGCPSCAHTGTSYVEQFILKSFKMVTEEVNSRDKSQIGMELDIYVPEFSLAIEPGAWEIHKKKLDRDNEKARLCKEKGIDLVVIYFLCKKENELFKDNINIYWYQEDLALEKNSTKLLSLVYKLFERVGINRIFTDEEIKEIKNYAYVQSRKITPEEFRERVHQLNPHIQVIGDYRATKYNVKCRCEVCGYEWMGNPQNLLKGHGCLQCSGSRKKTTEEFIEELRLINDKIQIIGEYENAHTKIECLCRNCGCEFVKAPKELLRGQGCPWCAGKRNSVNIIKKPYE